MTGEKFVHSVHSTYFDSLCFVQKIACFPRVMESLSLLYQIVEINNLSLKFWEIVYFVTFFFDRLVKI